MNQVHFNLSVATLEKFLFDILMCNFGKISQGADQNIAPVLIGANRSKFIWLSFEYATRKEANSFADKPPSVSSHT